MESTVKPGSFLLSKSTHKVARDFFVFEPLDKAEVQGKEEAQEARLGLHCSLTNFP